jgi:uncharacterized protein
MVTNIERDLFNQVTPCLNDPEIIVIHGARQVGKTSLAQDVMNRLSQSVPAKSLLWVDLEDRVWLEICNRSVDEFMRHVRAKGYDAERLLYVFLDEIQYLDNMISFLKLAYDRHKGRIKLIVTGTSTFSIKSKFKDSMVGRTIDFELFPLSFNEFLRFKGLSYDLGAADLPLSIHAELLPLYKEFILKGSYPAIALEEVEQKQEKKLKQIIATCVNTDISGFGKIRHIQKFNRLIEILAAKTGSLVNISELSETAGLAKQSVEEYLSILEDACFIRMLRPYFDKIKSEFTKMPKIFFEDSGIAHILENRSFSNKVTSNLFENSVFSELRKRVDGGALRYWRTSKNQEVDFVINKNRLIPIEAKLLFRERELTSLRYFVEKYGLKKAFVCTLEKPQKSPYNWLEIIYPWELASALNPD